MRAPKEAKIVDAEAWREALRTPCNLVTGEPILQDVNGRLCLVLSHVSYVPVDDILSVGPQRNGPGTSIVSSRRGMRTYSEPFEDSMRAYEMALDALKAQDNNNNN